MQKNKALGARQKFAPFLSNIPEYAPDHAAGVKKSSGLEVSDDNWTNSPLSKRRF